MNPVIPETKAPTRRRWSKKRIALATVGLLVAVVLLGHNLLLMTFLPDYVDQVLKREIGYHLGVGKFEVHLFDGELVANDVVLSPLTGGPPMATCTKVMASVDMSRLFTGVFIRKLVLENVRGVVARKPDGTVDFVTTIHATQDKLPRHNVSICIENLEARGVELVIREVAFVKKPHEKEVEHKLELDVFAANISSIDLGKDSPAGVYSVTGWGGDMAEKISIAGTCDFAGDACAMKARVVLDHLDPRLIAPILPQKRTGGRDLDLAITAGFSVAREGDTLVVDLVADDVRIMADHRRALSLDRGAATIEILTGQPLVVRGLSLARPEVTIERTLDRTLVVAGLLLPKETEAATNRIVVPATAAIAPIDSARAAGILDELALSLSGIAPESSAAAPWRGPSAAQGSPTPLPHLPLLALSITDGTIHIQDPVLGPDAVAITGLGVSELVLPGAGPTHAVLALRAEIPGVVGALSLELNGTLDDNRASVTGGVVARGITPKGFARVFGDVVSASEGDLELGLAFGLTRSAPTAFSGGLRLSKGSLGAGDDAWIRLEEVALSFAMDTQGSRPRIWLPKLEVRNPWIAAERTAEGDVRVGGFLVSRDRGEFAPGKPAPVPPPAGPRREPAFDLDIESAELTGVAIRWRDGQVKTSSDLTLDVTARSVLLGTPRVAAISLKGSATGLVKDLAIEGRVFPSLVSPGFLLDVKAAGLSSEVVRAYLAPSSWDVDLDDRRLDLRVGGAIAPTASGSGVVASITSLVLADRAGPALTLERARVELDLPADPALPVPVPLVLVVKPALGIGTEGGEARFARALRRLPSRPAAATHLDPLDLGSVAAAPANRTFKISRLSVEQGAVAITRAAGSALRVEQIELRARELELGPAARGSREVELTAVVPELAKAIVVRGSFASLMDVPHFAAEIEASGVDLDRASAFLPETFAGSRIHSGTLRAKVDADARLRNDGALTGELSIRDLAWLDERGVALLSLAEGRSSVFRLGPGDVSLSSLDLDRPHVALERDVSGQLVIAGLRTRETFLGLSDAERRAQERVPEGTLRATPAAVAPGARVGALPAPSSSSVAIDRLSIGGASFTFLDRATVDAAGQPTVLGVESLDLSVDRLVLAETAPLERPMNLFVEATLDGGGRLEAEGTLTRLRAGLDASLDLEARGLDLVRLSPYARNAAGIDFERGTLDATAKVGVTRSHVDGELELVAHRPRIVKASASPLVAIGSRVGVEAALVVLEDFEGDASLAIPFEGDLPDVKVKTGALLGHALGSALADAVQQPLKWIVRPLEAGLGQSMSGWLSREVHGRKGTLAGPVLRSAFFAAGDTELTRAGAQSVIDVAAFAAGTDRVVSIRACSGTADRVFAERRAALSPADARALFDQLKAERNAKERQRGDLAAAERDALEKDEDARAGEARGRLAALDATLGQLDASLDELANRVDSSGRLVARGRAREGLRRLANERVASVRRALALAGVAGDHVRVRLAQRHDLDAANGARQEEGVVRLEIVGH